MKPIIIVDSITKKYSRNANSHRSYGIRDLWRELVGGKPDVTLRKDEFLAVDNVSFTMAPGDSLAIIGRNGAGKTTMLKMMNGVTKPDAGTIVMDGRVQALINLGAGFNPVLSGRDNIYNSASLMGMGRREITAIVDEVIDFAELETFIDSPVETYSAGMKARLGFAVAIHLKPEILLVDEILAVGDYAFQNKCFMKMNELKRTGVSIVLVSHSHTSVVQMCEKALWMHHGRTMELGPAQDVVKHYLDFLNKQEDESARRAEEIRRSHAEELSRSSETSSREAKAGLYGAIFDDSERVEAPRVELLVNGQETRTIRVHDELTIRYRFGLKTKVSDLNVSLVLFRKDGVRISAISTLNGDLLKDVHEGEVNASVRIHDFNVNPGTYVLVMPIHEGKSYLYRDVVREFVVHGAGNLNWEIVDFKYDYEVEKAATGGA